MEFHENKAIFLQIGDLLCEQILAGTWPPLEKIPSVREMGVSLQVNPNTVLRTYDFLQQRGIIFNKRGIGYFVEEDAVKKILDFRREDFFSNTLPSFYKTISLLQIPLEEILRRFNLFQNDESNQTDKNLNTSETKRQ
ncbi:MAG TPA: GntR family transcriptional regulator [Bacteroidales bacterium]|nr:GntR family transcriptional regulator [Bacteroidales bacterium]